MTLLNNLKVQERQNRVCTTVAIAVVAESCQPFTVLPALMNEYRVPELNVQNGVLKASPSPTSLPDPQPVLSGSVESRKCRGRGLKDVRCTSIIKNRRFARHTALIGVPHAVLAGAVLHV